VRPVWPGSAGDTARSAGNDAIARCFCCKVEGPCECGSKACWKCGACPAHCECSRFLQCECERIDVDLDDARLPRSREGDDRVNVKAGNRY
jgi:hypothetical protein